MNWLVSRPENVLAFVSGLVLFSSVIGAFVGLTASSMWTDELFTAYFADPTQTRLEEVFLRSAEDTHPPIYYVLIWAVTRVVPGDFDVVARGLSAILACLSIIVLYFVPMRNSSGVARLVSCAFAAGSWIWFEYAQEARSYGLMFFLVSVCLYFACRAVRSLREPSHEPQFVLYFSGFCLFGIIACMSHYYAIPLVGAFIAAMMLFTQNWWYRACLAAGGLIILVLCLSYLGFHTTRIVVDTSDTVFSAAPADVIAYLLGGIEATWAGISQRVFWLILSTAFLVVYVADVWNRRPESPGHSSYGYVLFVALTVCLALVFALLVTFLYRPSLSTRFFFVLSPLFWVAISFMLQPVLDARMRDWFNWSVALMLSVALLGLCVKLTTRSHPHKEPWRETAQYVASLGSCSSRTLAVVWFDRTYFREDDPERFFGYYLTPSDQREWIKLPKDKVLEGLETDEMGAFLTERALQPHHCPVLLWAIYYWQPSVPDNEIIRIIKKRMSVPPTYEVQVQYVYAGEKGEPWIVVDHALGGLYGKIYMLKKKVPKT